MIFKIRGIVLKSVRHNDRTNIVTLFTEQRGRVSFVSSSGAGKRSQHRNAILSPLALIESEVNFHENRDLQMLGAVNVVRPWQNIYFDPSRSATALFLSEFLNQLLVAREKDSPLWNFLIQSIATLNDTAESTANFHLAFLIRMLPFLGIEPDTFNYRPGMIFDLREAEFSNYLPTHSDFIAGTEAAAIPTLCRMTYENMHRFRFNVTARRRLLDLLLKYYSIHLPIKEHLKSIEILKELFE